MEISHDKQSFNLTEPRDEHLRHATQELLTREKRPKVALHLSVVARLESPATWFVTNICIFIV